MNDLMFWVKTKTKKQKCEKQNHTPATLGPEIQKKLWPKGAINASIVARVMLHLNNDVVHSAKEVEGGEEVHHVSVHGHKLSHVGRALDHRLGRKVKPCRILQNKTPQINTNPGFEKSVTQKKRKTTQCINTKDKRRGNTNRHSNTQGGEQVHHVRVHRYELFHVESAVDHRLRRKNKALPDHSTKCNKKIYTQPDLSKHGTQKSTKTVTKNTKPKKRKAKRTMNTNTQEGGKQVSSCKSSPMQTLPRWMCRRSPSEPKSKPLP